MHHDACSNVWLRGDDIMSQLLIQHQHAMLSSPAESCMSTACERATLDIPKIPAADEVHCGGSLPFNTLSKLCLQQNLRRPHPAGMAGQQGQRTGCIISRPAPHSQSPALGT